MKTKTITTEDRVKEFMDLMSDVFSDEVIGTLACRLEMIATKVVGR